MNFHAKIALRIFSGFLEPYLNLFSDLKEDIKKSGMRVTLEEYLSVTLLVCTVLFLVEFPLFSFIFSLLKLGILFSMVMSITLSMAICGVFFFLFTNYPKLLIRDRTRSIEKNLPFAGIYLSTLSSSNLPPHKIFEIFSGFEEFGEVTKEIKRIVRDMEMFGLNVYEGLERAVTRTPSDKLRDLFWSILSTLRAGGNLSAYLSEKSKTFLFDYRRKLEEFSHSLTVFLEIYLTALVLGAIFFTILTSIMAGFGGIDRINIMFLQFFLIFFFIPLISFGFIVLVRSASPGSE